jgi:Tfp pilus assembly protein PilF
LSRIEKLVEFLKQSPTDSFLKHALALEYVKIEQDKEAEELFVEILRNEPTYVGSYYHLAKLYERNGEEEKAMECYSKGMEQAKAAKDNHALNELRMALEELED